MFEREKAELTEVYTSLYGGDYTPSPISMGVKLASLKAALAAQPRLLRVVDFGAGHGLILDYLKKEQLIRTGTGLDLVPGRDPWLVQAAWEPLDRTFDFAISTDFLEHIPPETVEATLRNIMAAAPSGFHSISTRPDTTSVRLGLAKPLHLTVQPGAWWKAQFQAAGAKITHFHDFQGRNVEIGY